SLTLDGPTYVYDSGAGALIDADHQTVFSSGQTVVQADSTPIAVLSVGRLTVLPGTRVTVTGPRPLLVVSWSAIVVAGQLAAGSPLGVPDAQTHTAGTMQLGAGADQGCTTETGQNGVDASPTGGSGGGGGGGLHGAGGPGGRGGGNSA